MLPVPQTPFYAAVLLFGNTAIPVLPGAQLTCPENWDVPPIVGNRWHFNYGDGFLQPTLDVSYVIRDKAGEALSSTLLNYFLTRTNDVAHDTLPITNGVTLWDGRAGFRLVGAKADSFSISCAKGQPIQFSARFVGFGDMVELTSAPAFTPWDATRVLRFNAINFNGNLAAKVWRFGLSFSNNHAMDMSLNGSRFAVNCNAGMMTAGLQLSMQGEAAGNIPPSGEPVEFTVTGGTNGGSRLLTATANNPLLMNGRNRAVTAPRIMRDYSFDLLGGTSTTVPPLSVVSSF